jgi:hypothetical protein
VRLRFAGLLDMREELLFLAAGLAGTGCGFIGTRVLAPFLT